MADYYTLYSFMVGSQNERDAQYLIQLASILQDISEIIEHTPIEDLGIDRVLLQSAIAQEIAHEEQYRRLPAAINYVKPNFEYFYGLPYIQKEGNDIWIHNDEGSSGIDQAVELIQIWLRSADNPPDHVAFEWSNTCSKPRTDGFGGGAAFITKDEIKWINPAQWIQEQINKKKEEIEKVKLDKKQSVRQLEEITGP